MFDNNVQGSILPTSCAECNVQSNNIFVNTGLLLLSSIGRRGMRIKRGVSLVKAYPINKSLFLEVDVNFTDVLFTTTSTT